MISELSRSNARVRGLVGFDDACLVLRELSFSLHVSPCLVAKVQGMSDSSGIVSNYFLRFSWCP